MTFLRHGTLTANTVATVTLPTRSNPNAPGAYSSVEIINVDGNAIIYFRVLSAVDSTAGIAPTVAGNDCEILPAVPNAMILSPPAEGGDPVVVKLISAGTPKYSVRAE